MSKLKTIFFGTPDIAVPYLELTNELTDVQLVVTQADKPRGRGMVITPCPVKSRALELGLPVRSPDKLKDIYEEVKNIPFDIGVVVAFGKIFRPDFLALAKTGFLNVHFSLLPLLRGAAPVQHSLFNNFSKTGVSVFWIAPGMDDGPLFLQKEISVAPQDDAQSLFGKLIPLGLEALKETLTRLETGEIIKIPQTGEPTLAPMIKKEDAQIRFDTLTAAQIHHKVRGLACGPKARAVICLHGKEEPLQILHTRLPDGTETAADAAARAGTVLRVESQSGILVKCVQGSIWITEVHPAGKKPMSAAAYANGHGIKSGAEVFVFHG